MAKKIKFRIAGSVNNKPVAKKVNVITQKKEADKTPFTSKASGERIWPFYMRRFFFATGN